jgi:hypothetical protein
MLTLLLAHYAADIYHVGGPTILSGGPSILPCLLLHLPKDLNIITKYHDITCCRC